MIGAYTIDQENPTWINLGLGTFLHSALKRPARDAGDGNEPQGIGVVLTSRRDSSVLTPNNKESPQFIIKRVRPDTSRNHFICPTRERYPPT